MKIDHIIWGSGTKVLLSATYQGSRIPPENLCVKGGFDPALYLDALEAIGGGRQDFDRAW